MASDKPLVSILTTSYNYGQYIGQTIQSVLDQTYDHWELIISDDASTDNSLEVIRSFDDPRITLITSEKNEGGPANRAKAYALCKGKYLTTLNSDDFIAPDKLEKQVGYLEEHPEVDILGSLVTEVDSTGQAVGNDHPHEAWFNQERDLNQASSWLWENHLCHSSVLLRKSVHDRIGQFNSDLTYLGDYEFWIRCLIAGAVFHVFQEKLTYYRFHGGNITKQDPERALVEHVYVFCMHLKPYLIKLNKDDIVNEGIAVFLSLHEPYQRADNNLKANAIASLLSIENQHRTFESFLQSIRNPASRQAQSTAGVIDSVLSKYRQQQTEIVELEWQNQRLIEWGRSHEEEIGQLEEQNQRLLEWGRSHEEEIGQLKEQNQRLLEWGRSHEEGIEQLKEQNQRLLEWGRSQEERNKLLEEQNRRLLDWSQAHRLIRIMLKLRLLPPVPKRE